MKTPLNNKVDDYYKKYPENPTIETLRNTFKDLNETNEYGSIAHAILNYGYDTTWILKVLELLFKNNVNVNLKAKNTGYSFIHLALYGYTDSKGNDKSYKTDFILKLISLGIKYGLDVNIQDNDGDSIVHTAIASEIYTGSILPIIEALGPEFNLEIKDNEKRTIKEALEYYTRIAVSDNNVTWAKRLKAEKEEINALLEVKNLDTLDLELKKLYENATLDSLFNNLEKIKKLEEQISKSIIIKNKKEAKKIDIEAYFAKYHNIAITIIKDSIKENLSVPKKSDIAKLEALLAYFKTNLGDDLKRIKDNYNQKVNKLKDCISAALTLNLINEALTLIDAFSKTTTEEEEYLNKEKEKLEALKEELEKIVLEIKNGLILNGKLTDWLGTFIPDKSKEVTPPDYETLNKKELETFSNILNSTNNDIKRKIFTFIKEALGSVYSSLKEPLRRGLITKEEIDTLIKDVYTSIFNLERKKKKNEN